MIYDFQVAAPMGDSAFSKLICYFFLQVRRLMEDLKVWWSYALVIKQLAAWQRRLK